MTSTPQDYDLARDFPKPKRKKRISAITGRATAYSPETELQVACIVAYDKQCRADRGLREKTFLYAINPVPQKTQCQAELSKRMGLRPGVADLHFIDLRSGEDIFMWIEMKPPVRREHRDGGLSVEQKQLFDWLAGTRIQRHVCYSVQEFCAVVGI